MHGTIPVTICEPLQSRQPFANTTAVASLGAVIAVATEGSAVTVTTAEHHAAQLLLPYSGDACWHCDGATYANPFGDSVLFLPPVALRLENTITSGVSLNIDPQLLVRTALTMAGPDGDAHRLRQALTQPQRLLWWNSQQRPLIDCIYRTLTSVDQALRATPAAALLRFDDLLIRLLLLLLLPELNQGPPAVLGSGRLSDLTDWIEANLNRAIGLTDLEAQAGCSRRTLQLRFRRQFGCTPMQWLRRRRLARAFQRLQQPQPGDSVGRIAQACGYSSLAAFSRDFKAEHGVRPSQLLRAGVAADAADHP